MRILLTSDLHYNVKRSRGPTEALAARLLRAGGDVLVLVGDSVATELSILERALALFDGFAGRRLLVAGNHELWAPAGGDSRRRYEVELAEVCRRHEVHYLDAAPYVAGDVAIVGNVGWYDYTFRPAALRIPLRFYQHKIAPGAALASEALRGLVDGREDLPAGFADITTRWMDGVHVRLGVSDVEFAHQAAARLRGHLEAARKAGAKRIVAALHHLPFFELVPRTIAPNIAFAHAFLGSEMLGEALLECPEVRHVYCGHSHRHRVCRKGALTATSIGSTYAEKRYETLDL